MLKKFEKIFGPIDKKIFFPLLSVFLIVITIGLTNEKLFKSIFDPMTEFAIFDLMWVVECFAFIVLVFLLVLACSKFGNIKIGKADEKPAYSTFSWISMCFCAGVGFGALLWFSSEGLFHLFQSSLVANEGLTGKPAGIPLALASGFMNWGVIGWSIFALCGLAVALPAFHLDKPMTLAGGLYGLMGEKAYTSPIGKFADFVGALGSSGGPASGLGVGLMLLTSGIAAVFGVHIGIMGQFGLVIFFCAAYTLSAYIGIDRGIKRLSTLSMYTVFALLLYIFLTGPTLFIANSTTEAFGTYISNFINLNFFTDAGHFVPQAEGSSKMVFSPRSWQSWWLIFYLIWWVAHAPFSGGFFARISRGRTVRQFIFGVIFIPSAFVILAEGVLSSAACYLQVSGEVDVYTALCKDAGSALFTTLASYPLAKLIMFMMLLCCIFFGITTFDAATYFVSVQTSGGNINPKPTMKLLWGIILGVVALVFLSIGNFNGLKGLGVLAGVPFIAYMFAYIISVWRMCKMISCHNL